VVISAANQGWESRVQAAFKRRVEFELRDTNKLHLTDAGFFRLVADWRVKWNYTPTMINETTVQFSPDLLPPKHSALNPPRPTRRRL
jgi:hypothetical protein